MSTTRIVNYAVERAAEVGPAQAWVEAERKFSHLPPAARRFAFGIFSRVVTRKTVVVSGKVNKNQKQVLTDPTRIK